MPCVYCGASDDEVGHSCSASPTQKHVIDDPNKCRYCGADADQVVADQVGGSCSYSPTRKHILANGGNKCVFCGADADQVGRPCSNNPTFPGKHALTY